MRAPRRRPGYVNAPQYELPMDGGFRLLQEQTADGEREQRERDQSTEARDNATKAQSTLF